MASEVNACDLARTVGPGLGADVDEDEPGQAPAVLPGPRQRVGATQRHAHEDEPLDPQGLEEGLQVAGVALGRVVHLGRPLALAVAALVQGQAVPLAPQGRAHEIPRVRVEAAAVEEHHGREARRSPVEIVKAHLPEQEVVLTRQHDFGKANAGGGRRQFEMRAKLVSTQAHAGSSQGRVLGGTAHARP